MNAVSTLLTLGLLALTAPVVAQDDWHWQPRVISGVQFYSLDKTVQTDIDGATFDAETPAMIIAGLGGSVIYGPWYLDVTTQQAKTTSFASTSASDSEQRIERTDFALSLGRQLPYRLSVFGGYKLGATDIEEDFVVTREDTETETNIKLTFNTRFVVRGPFIGVSYGIPLGERSLLSATSAYGLLKASFASNLPFPATDETTYDSGSSGLSGGVSLKTAFYKDFLLINAVNCQRYRFDFDYPDSHVSIKARESICNLALSLGYSF